MRVSENIDGTVYYVDIERIRKHDGDIFYWLLGDYLKPDPYGDLSVKTYEQGDCKLFRLKILSYSYHKEPMGMNTIVQKSVKNPEWTYLPPNTPAEHLLKSACEYVN